PTRRNSRISLVNCCCCSIHARSSEGASAAMRPPPNGEDVYPRNNSRNDSNSSTPALVWIRGMAYRANVTGRKRSRGQAGWGKMGEQTGGVENRRSGVSLPVARDAAFARVASLFFHGAPQACDNNN